MGYDPIQCTRAYLTLWKLVDRLFPGSRWLEIGEVPSSELRDNAANLLSASYLDWCDVPRQLKKDAALVLQLLDTKGLEEGAVARLEQLRAELRDRALEYAKGIKPDELEWQSTFNWEPRKADGA